MMKGIRVLQAIYHDHRLVTYGEWIDVLVRSELNVGPLGGEGRELGEGLHAATGELYCRLLGVSSIGGVEVVAILQTNVLVLHLSDLCWERFKKVCEHTYNFQLSICVIR